MKIFIIKNEVVKSKSTLKINRRGAARRNTGQRQYGAVGDSKDFSQKITSLKIKNMAADLLKETGHVCHQAILSRSGGKFGNLRLHVLAGKLG